MAHTILLVAGYIGAKTIAHHVFVAFPSCPGRGRLLPAELVRSLRVTFIRFQDAISHMLGSKYCGELTGNSLMVLRTA